VAKSAALRGLMSVCVLRCTKRGWLSEQRVATMCRLGRLARRTRAGHLWHPTYQWRRSHARPLVCVVYDSRSRRDGRSLRRAHQPWLARRS